MKVLQMNETQKIDLGTKQPRNTFISVETKIFWDTCNIGTNWKQ